MKMIDLLVQELPNHGGWPEGAVICERFVDEANIDFYDSDGNWPVDCHLKYGAFFAKACVRVRNYDMFAIDSVTREQYEAALADSQKPVWDGEGLPPVGTECDASIDGGENWTSWHTTAEDSGVVIFGYLDGRHVAFGKKNMPIFRPIHTEAERKREQAIVAMVENIDMSSKVGQSVYSVIYDAIAAGKIPGIKLL